MFITRTCLHDAGRKATGRIFNISDEETNGKFVFSFMNHFHPLKIRYMAFRPRVISATGYFGPGTLRPRTFLFRVISVLDVSTLEYFGPSTFQSRGISVTEHFVNPAIGNLDIWTVRTRDISLPGRFGPGSFRSVTFRHWTFRLWDILVPGRSAATHFDSGSFRPGAVRSRVISAP